MGGAGGEEERESMIEGAFCEALHRLGTHTNTSTHPHTDRQTHTHTHTHTHTRARALHAYKQGTDVSLDAFKGVDRDSHGHTSRVCRFGIPQL